MHVRPFYPPVPTREISIIYQRNHWKLGIIRAIEETITQSLPKDIHRQRVKGSKVLDVC